MNIVDITHGTRPSTTIYSIFPLGQQPKYFRFQGSTQTKSKHPYCVCLIFSPMPTSFSSTTPSWRQRLPGNTRPEAQSHHLLVEDKIVELSPGYLFPCRTVLTAIYQWRVRLHGHLSVNGCLPDIITHGHCCSHQKHDSYLYSCEIIKIMSNLCRLRVVHEIVVGLNLCTRPSFRLIS